MPVSECASLQNAVWEWKATLAPTTVLLALSEDKDKNSVSHEA